MVNSLRINGNANSRDFLLMIKFKRLVTRLEVSLERVRSFAGFIVAFFRCKFWIFRLPRTKNNDLTIFMVRMSKFHQGRTNQIVITEYSLSVLWTGCNWPIGALCGLGSCSHWGEPWKPRSTRNWNSSKNAYILLFLNDRIFKGRFRSTESFISNHFSFHHWKLVSQTISLPCLADALVPYRGQKFQSAWWQLMQLFSTKDLTSVQTLMA